MKKLYFLFFFTIGFLVNAQIVNIPDTKFKALLLSASPTDINYQIAQNLSGQYVKIDSNNDGEIQIIEAQQIKKLNQYCNSCSVSQKITSLEGIQSFVNLTDLQLTYHNISNINILNDLINLQTINFSSNWIENISLPNLVNLTSLSLRNNYISNISLSNYKNLVSVSLENNLLSFLNLNDLKYLNQVLIANNPNLTHLFFVNHVENFPFPVNFGSNSNVRYLCVDEFDIASATSTFNTSNTGTPIVVNQYCQPFYDGLGLNILTGNIVFDYNSNGCEINDVKLKNTKLVVQSINDTEVASTNEDGIYEFFLKDGNYTITPQLENPNYFNISPTSFTANFPIQASPFSQDFCVTANGVHHDVEIVIIPINRARPGFDAKYKIVYNNKGNQIENGTVVFTFLNQDALDIVLSNPIYNSDNNDGFERSFSWNYSNLLPFESREIEVVLNLNSPIETPALNGGDLLNLNANITPLISDEYINDNEMSLRQIIVNSFDPNDKTCLQGESIAPSEVGQYVHYLIRFENTGTYPAENIVVKDMIDLAKFDIATLVPLKSSHDFYTRINGNKVEFIFENINLDFNDATNDGYVVFKIKTLPTLVLGDTFTNDANIYFDYNFPITTNTYTTTVAALSTQDYDFGTYFTLYPNPAKDVLNIQSKQNVAINSVEIYNQLGQIVIATTNAINSIDVANLASGAYFVKVNTEKGSANAKFVKE